MYLDEFAKFRKTTVAIMPICMSEITWLQ